MDKIRTFKWVPAFRVSVDGCEPYILSRAGKSGIWYIYPVRKSGLVRLDLSNVCNIGFVSSVVRQNKGVEYGTICGYTFLTSKEEKSKADKKFSAGCGLVAKF